MKTILRGRQKANFGAVKICLFGNKEKYNPEQILILKLLLLWYIIAL